ncbi:MAG: hypothetical protein JNG84_11505 [Archangium sp.]|nr:hypothetical protein [Archangium sp.]
MKRIHLDATASSAVRGRASLLLSRSCGVPPRALEYFVAHGGTLPLGVADGEAATLVAALRELGVSSAAVDGPPTAARRCSTHAPLEANAECASCRRQLCASCAAVDADGLCLECLHRQRRKNAFRNARVAVLLLTMAGVVLWGIGRARRLDRRTSWERPLRISVVLLATRPLTDQETSPWASTMEALDAWFSREWARFHAGETAAMVQWQLETPAVVAALPGIPTSTSDTIALGQRLDDVDRGISAPVTDATIYVVLSAGNEAELVEGIGEAGGRRGLVFGRLGDTDVQLEATAIAHELLHCLGASDKYDGAGHARVPEGLVAPEQEPRYPQPAAEVMVGEKPTAPNEGTPARRLDEVQIGPTTAREVRWTR